MDGNNWLQFHIEVPPEEVVLLEEKLGDLVCSLSWSLEGKIEGIAEEQARSEIENRLEWKVVWKGLDNRDWLEEQASTLPPVQTDKFYICGPHEMSKVPEGAIPLVIRSAYAFGSGHHPTTRGCLRLLESLKELSRVLDLGCGSGILALAASRLFDLKVVASDIEPESVKLTQENAGERVDVILSDGLAHPRLREQSPYDLIMANIHSAVLCRIAPDINTVSARVGKLILSGFLEEQREEVRQAYESLGFFIKTEIKEEGWVTVLMERK